MEDDITQRPVARWFTAAAIVSLLLMVLPLLGAAIHLATDPAGMPLDQRAQYEAEPLWMVLAFGLAGLAGTLGGLMLVVRRRAAEPLLVAALVAIAVWFAGLFVNAQLRDLLTTVQIAAAMVIVAIVWTIFWFARHSRQRGWLR